MKAMYYDAFEKTPEIRTFADPTPTENGVVVKVEATGLCRSDGMAGWGTTPTFACRTCRATSSPAS